MLVAAGRADQFQSDDRINATADPASRLAESAASLFNHAGGGHQQKINKSAAGRSASQM